MGAVSNHYTIINNDGADAVTGIFAGLPEGATVVANNGAHFSISYKAGTGNDVVLTQTGLPVIPEFTGIIKTGGGLSTLNGTGLSNTIYHVQATTNLATTNWVTLGPVTVQRTGRFVLHRLLINQLPSPVLPHCLSMRAASRP